MSLAFDDLVRPVDDEAGSLVQLKTLKLPEHASRGSNGGNGGKRAGKLIYVMTSGIFHPENWGKIKRMSNFYGAN